jgi:response regulator of citrate/malate metabolism
MIRVLIVEDDPMVAYLNEKYINQLSQFKIVGKVNNGEEALHYLNSNACDLVILDVYMPKVDGIEVLKEIRKNFIQVDVIFVTAAKEHEIIDQALKLGAVDYLVKPFEFDRFKQALESYLVRHDLLLKKSQITQQDIDKMTKMESKQYGELPKGLQQKTLDKVMTVLGKHQEEFLSADEVADLVGISRVTVRRYLEYQESIGVLTCEIKYGSVGRPSYVYRMI